MGALWSKKGNQFEKALEKLDNNITHIENRQRTAHINKRRFVTYLIYTAILSELVIVVWFYFHRKPVHVVDRIVDGSPLVLPPIVAYLLISIISFYYTQRIKSDEIRLVNLRSQLKTKLDERKKATEFDATQQLLSKYERLTKNEEPHPPPSTSPKSKKGSSVRQRRPPSPTPPTTTTPPPPPAFAQVPAMRPPAPSQQPPHPSQQPQHPQHPQQLRRPPMPSGEASRSWLDKLVDYVVGGEPQHSFALICTNCKAHNGLVPKSEMDHIQFRCRFCNFFNQTSENETTPSSSSSSSSSSPPAPPPAPAPAITANS